MQQSQQFHGNNNSCLCYKAHSSRNQATPTITPATMPTTATKQLVRVLATILYAFKLAKV